MSHFTEEKSEATQDEHLVRVVTASKWNLDLTLKDSLFLEVLSDFRSSGSLRKEAVWTSTIMLELKKKTCDKLARPGSPLKLTPVSPKWVQQVPPTQPSNLTTLFVIPLFLLFGDSHIFTFYRS